MKGWQGESPGNHRDMARGQGVVKERHKAKRLWQEEIYRRVRRP